MAFRGTACSVWVRRNPVRIIRVRVFKEEEEEINARIKKKKSPFSFAKHVVARCVDRKRRPRRRWWRRSWGGAVGSWKEPAWKKIIIIIIIIMNKKTGGARARERDRSCRLYYIYCVIIYLFIAVVKTIGGSRECSVSPPPFCLPRPYTFESNYV